MLHLFVHLQVALLRATTSLASSDAPRSCAGEPPGPGPDGARRCRGSSGQTTVEYALVLLGAAALAALVVAWAAKSGAIGKLFDAVISHVIGSVK